MSLVSLQPNQTFHGHLVQSVVICPIWGPVMTNLRAAIFASPSVVVITWWIHCGPVTFHQAMGRVANDHFRAWIREVDWNINPQCVLSVAGARYSNFNSGVTSRIDPSRTASAKILLKQLLLVAKPRLLRCWPRHDANTVLKASVSNGDITALTLTLVSTEKLNSRKLKCPYVCGITRNWKTHQ